MYLLGLATFVTFLSAQLVTPVVPFLADELGAEESNIAEVSGLYIILLAFFQIFTGFFADRYGKRRTIALGASVGAVSSVLVVFAVSWSQLLVMRAIGAIADAFVGPALLALAAELSGKEKGKAMGFFRGSQGLAITVGPMIGGILAHFFSIYAPFYLDFGLTIIGVLVFLLLIPEAKRRGEKAAFSFGGLRFLKKDLTLVKIACLGFSETFAYASLSTFLPALAIGLGMSEVELAILFTAEAIFFTLTNLLVGSLSDRMGRRPIMILGLACTSMNLIAFFLAVQFWQLVVLMAIFGFGSSSVYLMSTTMAADILPDENRAMLFGAFDAMIDLGMVVGPSLCFAVFSVSGWRTNSSFVLAAGPSILALVLVFKTRETKA
jgi:MFS family permease